MARQYSSKESVAYTLLLFKTSPAEASVRIPSRRFPENVPPDLVPGFPAFHWTNTEIRIKIIE